MYKCTIANDVKENPKSSSQFNLIGCIYIIFINMEKQESRFFLVITVLRKWVSYKLFTASVMYNQSKAVLKLRLCILSSADILW